MRKVLLDGLCSMAEAFLTSSWVSTAGDTGKKWFLVDKGVPQGSPLSPSLYNIFIHESEKECARHKNTEPTYRRFYLQTTYCCRRRPQQPSKGYWTLQRVGAEERGMIWNTNRGKREILLSDDTENYSLHLAGKAPSMVPEVTYLGISPSQAGVSDTKLLGRVKKAKIRSISNCENWECLRKG